MKNGEIVGRRLSANGVDERRQPALELAEQFPDRSRGHAFIGIVDVRIGDVGIRRENYGIFAAEFERPLEVRDHDLEVVRRPRARPFLVRRGAMGMGARHPIA